MRRGSSSAPTSLACFHCPPCSAALPARSSIRCAARASHGAAPRVLTALIGTPVFIWLLAATLPENRVTIAARALDFGYPRHVVGRGMDLSLEDGEVLCVLGPNGSGKTTLFRTLLGLLPPLRGSVTVDGKDVSGMARADLARRIAYVPQASATYFDFTLEEMALMGRTAHLGTFAAPTAHDRRSRPRRSSGWESERWPIAR
jgi:ABC-type multidrug transport system fused ATPase/permease subunit